MTRIDLIQRGDALDALQIVGACSTKEQRRALSQAYDKLHRVSAVEAVPVVHARWEWREYWGCAAFQDPPDIYDSGWACSACGVDLLQYLQSHFPDIPSYTECASEEKPTVDRCPNCGAKMDGGASDE